MMEIQDLEMMQILNRNDWLGNTTIVYIQGGDGFFEMMDSLMIDIEIVSPIVEIMPIFGGFGSRSGFVEGNSSSTSNSFMMS